jgi:type II secretory pathway pseudopilin PulG
MEVLLVLIILVVIGSIVAPNVFGAKDKADIKAATAQLALSRTPVRSYWLAMSKYPTAINELIEKPSDAAEARSGAAPTWKKLSGQILGVTTTSTCRPASTIPIASTCGRTGRTATAHGRRHRQLG